MNIKEALDKYRNQVLSRESYRMNLVEILGANENAHTRILEYVLKYDRFDGRGKAFLKSFVDSFLSDYNLKVANPQVNSQVQYIDAIIAEHGLYAIVIENKINWAVDQDAQIERYVKAAMDIYNVSGDNIYVIYLTDDGRKKIADYSLTEKVRKVLGVTDEDPGRFVELNYQHDVLPWLELDALRNCRYRETELISALEQYILYLKARFGALENHDVRDAENEYVMALLAECKDDTARYVALRRLLEEPIDVLDDDVASCRRLRSFFWERSRNILSHDYSIDYAGALSLRSGRVREWAKKSGFKPRKYYEGTTYFQFHKGERNARIKFQISFSGQNGGTWIQFFDNDRVYHLSEFKGLVELARKLFAGMEDVDPYTMMWKTAAIRSEHDLMTLLNGPVKTFLDAFCSALA